MIFNGKLVLEDGSSFRGTLIGAKLAKSEMGEVVFNTSMVGYQEILSDPSYCDQIICMTYPLIGNYGVSEEFFESRDLFCKGLIIKDLCTHPSHFSNENTLNSLLVQKDLCGLCNVDTRALTKTLREHGTIKGLIVSSEVETSKVVEKLKNTNLLEQVSKVSKKEEEFFENSSASKHVVLVDFGYKGNILKNLKEKYKVTVVPFNSSFEKIKSLNPDGVCLSNGPGDPMDLQGTINMINTLQDHFPIFGICLGHQLLSLANGAKTEKMLYGHRGGNHPVKDVETGKVYMSSQNHGFIVTKDSLEKAGLDTWFINVNDKSVEGVKVRGKKAISVQFHPEHRPGPRDTNFLFEEFEKLMESN